MKRYAAQIRDSKATRENIRDMSGNMDKIERLEEKIRTQIKELRERAKDDDRKMRQFDKVDSKLKTEMAEYNKNKNDYRVLANEKNAVKGSFSVGDSFASGSFADGGTNDVAIMKVYDQADFINRRDDNIKKLNQDAKTINHLAADINTKIYEQDEKLNEVTKKMGGQVQDVKEANKELVKAKEMTSRRNKNMLCWVLLIFVLCLILGVTIYFLFKSDEDSKSGGNDNNNNNKNGTRLF